MRKSRSTTTLPAACATRSSSTCWSACCSSAAGTAPRTIPAPSALAPSTCARLSALTKMLRRWEQHAHAQAQVVEATLERVRSMQNDMSNLSLDALVTLKHELSGAC